MLILFDIVESIKSNFFELYGKKVMHDNDLAGIYEIEVGQLKCQVRKNIDRFPKDIMFELTNEESVSLRCQNGTLKT